jgi:hypothetical protein
MTTDMGGGGVRVGALHPPFPIFLLQNHSFFFEPLQDKPKDRVEINELIDLQRGGGGGNLESCSCCCC